VWEQHASEVDAYNGRARIIKQEYGEGTPPLNLTSRWNRYQNVRHIETGHIYRNATEACKALGIPQPRLSLHLAKRPGHKTIKGMTFEYVNYNTQGLNKKPQIPWVIDNAAPVSGDAYKKF
jgi:hypothetical protein